MRTTRSSFLLVAICMALALVVAPLAQANHCNQSPTGAPVGLFCEHRHGPDPCVREGGQGEGNGDGQSSDPLCLPGPASCVAVGVAVEVTPSPGLNVQLSRSVASTYAGAFAFTDEFGHAFAQGYASAHGDAHQARVTAGLVAAAGAIESKCDASSSAYAETFRGQTFFFQTDHADGRADVAQFSIDLNPLGVPLTIAGDVLCEHGSSTDGIPDPPPMATCTPGGDTGPTAPGMGNRANVANLLINGVQVIPTGLTSMAPNTWIPLGIADVYLNEQDVSYEFGCPTFWGDALRVVVPGVATVTISHVATTTCGKGVIG